MATTTAPTRVANAKTASGSGAADVAPAEPAKKSKKKLIIIVVVLLLGFGVYYKMGMKSSAAHPEPKAGAVLAMDATTLNLADGHFLKIKIGLQATTKAKAEMDTSKAADIVISEFTNRPMESMVTAEARAAIKADLLKKLQDAYPEEIMGVYLTEFVMQ
jgi:flagellar FliL protein